MNLLELIELRAKNWHVSDGLNTYYKQHKVSDVQVMKRARDLFYSECVYVDFAVNSILIMIEFDIYSQRILEHLCCKTYSP